MDEMDDPNDWWWDGTYNPVCGCTPVSPGCRYCYAQEEAGTRQTFCRIPLYVGTTKWVRGRPVWNGHLTTLPPGDDDWTLPLTWPGALHPKLGPGMPSLLWACSTSDLFHEDRE